MSPEVALQVCERQMAEIWGRFEADEPATQLSIVLSRRVARLQGFGFIGSTV